MTAIYRPPPRIRRSAKVAACFALAGSSVLLGCSDDSSNVSSSASTTTEATNIPAGSTTTAASSNDELYCETALGLDSDPGPDIDWATATPEDIGKGFGKWAPTMLAQVERMEAIVPDELKDELAVLTNALKSAEKGDPSAFESPDMYKAQKTLFDHDLAKCDWPTIGVTTRDYAFSGIPKTASPGALSIAVNNKGPEVHEVSVMSVPSHVHGPLKQLLSVDQQTGTRLRTVGSTGPIEPGADGQVILNLEPGRYVVACFIPTGTTSMQALESAGHDAKPHFAEGMATEFTVE